MRDDLVREAACDMSALMEKKGLTPSEQLAAAELLASSIRKALLFVIESKSC